MQQSRSAIHLVTSVPTPSSSPWLNEPNASSNSRTSSIDLQTISLVDKLQILAMLRPNAFHALERLVDGLLARLN